jgi:hypothetical protein
MVQSTGSWRGPQEGRQEKNAPANRNEFATRAHVALIDLLPVFRAYLRRRFTFIMREFGTTPPSSPGTPDCSRNHTRQRSGYLRPVSWQTRTAIAQERLPVMASRSGVHGRCSKASNALWIPMSISVVVSKSAWALGSEICSTSLRA